MTRQVVVGFLARLLSGLCIIVFHIPAVLVRYPSFVRAQFVRVQFGRTQSVPVTSLGV